MQKKKDRLIVSFPCQLCTGEKHTKFSCPKLHFMLIQQHVINRYLHNEKICKNKRNKYIQRSQQPRQSALVIFLYHADIYEEKKRQQEVNSLLNKKYGKQKYAIDQLKGPENDNTIQNIEKQKQTTNYSNLNSQQMMNQFQTSLIKKTSKIIKMQFAIAFECQKGEDNVWSLDSDGMKNYNDYFAENNPCNLVYTFDVENRIDKLMKTIVFDEELLSNYSSKSSVAVSILKKSIKIREN